MSSTTRKNLGLVRSRIRDLVGSERLSRDQWKEIDKAFRKLDEGVKRGDRKVIEEAIARVARAFLAR